ncbi:MAG: hypothetical protein WBF55_07790, partial [Syntrophobacteria bacterium]
LRRTVQVRLGTNTLRLPGGTPIFFALAALRSVPQAGSQFRGLATAIHEISGPEEIILGRQEPTAMLGIQKCRTRIRCGSSTDREYSIQADQLGFAD